MCNKLKSDYDLIYNHFHDMENRYHTWMNYYSLFNGGLLVAYCTILVSTGKICVEDRNVKLVCGYWDILILISTLGIVASYCWYLSIIGHLNWIDSWRQLLKKENKYFDNSICTTEKESKNCCGKGVLPHFHSTAKITIFFVSVVLLAWISIGVYSYFQLKEIQLSITAYIVSLFFFIFLLCLENFLHYVLGSDVSDFKILSGEKEKLLKRKDILLMALTGLLLCILISWN